jgi:aspartate aminotransferase-like enzyme
VTFLFTPGPVNVRPEVLAAQARPLLPVHGQEFKNLLSSTAAGLQPFLGTQRPVFLSPGSSSILMEAALRNLVLENVLCVINGVYGQRWYDIALVNGKNAARLEVNDGESISPDLLRTALEERFYDAITLQHVDASTGAINPLRELAAVVHETSPETLLLVDAAASLGGCPVEMDAWGIDFIFSVSHCCLALPPGLVVACASERGLKTAETIPNRGWSFDLLQWERHRLKATMPVTPPVSLLNALDVQLMQMRSEGMENRFARHAALAQMMHEWSEKSGVRIMATPGVRSPTITCLVNRPGLLFADLDRFLLERGMNIAEGFGRLCERTFRVAHMGETQVSDLEALLEALDMFFLG